MGPWFPPFTVSNPVFDSISMAPVLVHVERHLKKPEFPPVKREALTAVAPILGDVDVDFIRYKMQELGPGLLEVRNAAVMSTITTEEMPTHMQLKCRDLNGDAPTHVMAVYSDEFRVSETTFFPVHAIALASACANLPPFPESNSPLSLMADQPVVTVPVVPLKVRSTVAFRELLPWLYTDTSSLKTVLAGFLPFEDDGEQPYQLMGIRHGTMFSVGELLEDAGNIYTMWCTAIDIGIGDDLLYNTLEMAWEVCMTALSYGHKQNVDDGVDLLI